MSMYFLFYIFHSLFLLRYTTVETICSNTPKCTCQHQKKGSNRMKCIRIEKVEELLLHESGNVFSNISQLDLSNNNITSLLDYSFRFISLTKLNLDKNKIEWIEKNAFAGLVFLRNLTLSNNKLKKIHGNMFTGLRSLDTLNLDKNKIEWIEDDAFSSLVLLRNLVLSNNKLKLVHKRMFSGLKSLDTLKLNQNKIITLSYDTFEQLKMLTKLSISGNPLICNCDIWWLRTSNISLIVPFPKCDSPSTLQGQVIDKVTLMNAECNWDNDPVHTFHIVPDKNQVAFEKDSLEIICRIDGLKDEESVDSYIMWMWEGINPISVFENTVQSQNTGEKNNKYRESSMTINNLNDKHSGEWTCNFFISRNMIHRASIRVDVISDSTIYCGVLVTESDKGRYAWPQTLAGHKVDLPCEINDENGTSNMPFKFITQTCSNTGIWTDLNTDSCPYISSETRILQQFLEMNLTNHKESLIESAIGLQNFTCNHLENITNTDFHFIVSIIENYIKFVESETELAVHLIKIVACVLKLPKMLMWKAQQQHEACSRLIAAIDLMLKYTFSLEFQSSEITVKKYPISSDTFAGVFCSSLKHLDRYYFNCSDLNQTVPKATPEMDISIQISSDLFYHHTESKTLQLSMTLFKDNRLFPDRNNIKTESSIVVSVNLIGIKINTLNEPISISVKNKDLTGSMVPILAWWDADSSNWIKEGCRLSSSNNRDPILVYLCDRLGYFLLMIDHEHDIIYSEKNVQRKVLFNFLHPLIYVGTFISVTCLMVSSATYCFCYVFIQMSKRMKHSLTNTWLSASLFFLIFSIGIHQTEHEIICQIIGLAIHYFALATLFWMAVTVKVLYKRIQKSNPSSISTPLEDIPTDVNIEKPILGIYLVGWGISCILCGIAAAINIKGYSWSPSSSLPSTSLINNSGYCFLSPGPALSTVFIPASLVLFYLLVMCLLVKCIASNPDSNPQLSVGTQAIDLELLDGGGCGFVGVNTEHNSYVAEEHCSVRSISTPSSQTEDTEHSPIRQLKAFAIFLILYILATMCAAVYIMRPFQWQYEEKVFSFLYACLCVLLGGFVIFFHCLARNDIRSAWKHALQLKSLRTSPHIITNSLIVPLTCALNGNNDASAGGGVNVGSQNVSTAKVVSLDEHSNKSKFLRQMSNINVVRIHRQHYREGCATATGTTIDSFYNPYQSIVAKKFFKKQRRKRNSSLQVRKCRSGGSSPISIVSPFINGVVVPTRAENLKLLRCAAPDEVGEELHPLTYDEANITSAGREEVKTGTESEATFTIPEYAEIQDKSMNIILPYKCAETKEQMCGTSDHDWCSCDAISDVNSEPTYNYAYVRNGGEYPLSRSFVSDNSSVNSHLYTSVAANAYIPKIINPVNRRRQPNGSETSSSCSSYGGKDEISNANMKNHRHKYCYRLPSARNIFTVQTTAKTSPVKHDLVNPENLATCPPVCKKRVKQSNYNGTIKNANFAVLTPSNNFSSEEKVESCV